MADAAAPPVILASASPRRSELLRMLGVAFEVMPASVDETIVSGESPTVMAERLAREKVEWVAARRPEALVIGSDTVVLVEDGVLGKPADARQAIEMLMLLQGREHRVASGVAVAAPGGGIEQSLEVVRVRMRPFGKAIAEAYVRTGEPLDKAGAYGIQGYGATLVDYIEGDFFAVMGLPIARMISLLRALGWEYDFTGFRPLQG
ncbi:MAG: Maf family protein [Longimicrobiales bacterium]